MIFLYFFLSVQFQCYIEHYKQVHCNNLVLTFNQLKTNLSSTYYQLRTKYKNIIYVNTKYFNIQSHRLNLEVLYPPIYLYFSFYKNKSKLGDITLPNLDGGFEY